MQEGTPIKLDDKTIKELITSQKNEYTEHIIYAKLADSIKDENNKRILKKISEDELAHYNFWKKYTKQEVKPSQFKIWKYYLLSRILGVTFGIKLMEKGEEGAQLNYGRIAKLLPAAKKIAKDEEDHEKQLISLINEERLQYVGSIVLGINDALVELTGALAGLTFAFQNTSLIAVAGLITGIAAALSMGASEYLSTKSEETTKNPLKASIYTGLVYFLTVMFLIAPYLIFTNMFIALAATIINAVIVIFAFTYYISIAKDIPFTKRFIEMTSISLGVAALTFVIGFIVRQFLHVEI